MASRADAIVELDAVLEQAARDITRWVGAALQTGQVVEREDIAMLFLDEVFLGLSQDLHAFLEGVEWADGVLEDAVELRDRGILDMEVALIDTEQVLWEAIGDILLGDHEGPPLEDTVENILWELREAVAGVLDTAAPTSPSGSEEDEEPSWEGDDGVVLPLARRRRRA